MSVEAPPLPKVTVEPVQVGRATGWRAVCSLCGIPVSLLTQGPAVSRSKLDSMGEAERHLRAVHEGRGTIRVRSGS